MRTCDISCVREATSITANCAWAAGVTVSSTRNASANAISRLTMTSLLAGRSIEATTPAWGGQKHRQPQCGAAPVRADQTPPPLEVTRASRDHRELRLAALQIQPADDAVMPLLDEEHARARIELLLDELEFALAEAEALHVLGGARLAVREEHLGGRLLDDGAADRTVQHVARALRRERHHAIQLAPGLRAIPGKALERRVRQQPPELIHPAHQTPAVEELAHQVKDVERDRGAQRSEEHTSELQSPCNLVCRLLLEKKKQTIAVDNTPSIANNRQSSPTWTLQSHQAMPAAPVRLVLRPTTHPRCPAITDSSVCRVTS